MRSRTPMLLLAVTILGCGRAAPPESPDLGPRLQTWPERFSLTACWLALAETPQALAEAWPAVHRRVSSLESPLTVAPAWVAVEMGALDPTEGREAWAEAVALIEEAPPETARALRSALGRHERWLMQWEAAEATLRSLDGTIEQLMAAAFAQPETRGLFRAVVESRGWTLEEADPDAIGASLASAESQALTVGILRVLAAIGEQERSAWRARAAAYLETHPL